jgi:uncharacterized protein YjbI with pentapeptide repeats
MANPTHLALLKAGPEALGQYYSQRQESLLDLSGADLRGHDFSGWLLWGCDFHDADLAGASFAESEMRRCLFWDTDLRDTVWDNANLSLEGFTGVKDNTVGTLIINSNVQNASFQGACLRDVSFCGSDLQGADFTNADLLNAHFFQSGDNLTNLSRAKFISARLSATEARGSENDARTAFGQLAYFELARTKGLESALFEEQDFVTSYLRDVLSRMNKIRAADERAENFYKHVLSSIGALRTLYSNQAIPQPLIEVVSTINDELISHLRMNPKEIYKIKPRQFEELIAELLASFGWDVALTPPSKDGGYDIFAITKDIAGLQSSWIIECKKYAPEHKVEVSIARELYAVKSEFKVANALLATTSSFTRGATEFAASRYDFKLKDLEGILEWINTYRPHPGGRLYIKNSRIHIPGAPSPPANLPPAGGDDGLGSQPPPKRKKVGKKGEKPVAAQSARPRDGINLLPQRPGRRQLEVQLLEAIKSSGVADPDVDLFLGVIRGSVPGVRDALERGGNPGAVSTEVIGKHQGLFTAPPNSTRYAQYVFGNHSHDSA